VPFAPVAPRREENGVAQSDAQSTVQPVEAAIMRVLEAERAARTAAEEAHRQAAERVERARAEATEVAKRAERRIRRIQSAFERRVAAEKRAVEAEIAALVEAEVTDAQTRLVEVDAVARLAAALTGGDQSGEQGGDRD
jgi:hypothetical protein